MKLTSAKLLVPLLVAGGVHVSAQVREVTLGVDVNCRSGLSE